MLQVKCRCLQQKGRNITETKLKKMPPNCWNTSWRNINSTSIPKNLSRRNRVVQNESEDVAGNLIKSHRMKKKETIELLQRQYSPESSPSDEGHQQSSYDHTLSTSKSSPLAASSHNKQSLKLSVSAVRQRYVRQLQQAKNANDQLKRKIRSIQR